MDQRSEYLTQLLEKIGVPLMEAVSARQGAGTGEGVTDHDAREVAALLAKTIQVSIDIGKNMDLGALEDQGESVRVALAALAGSIVAEQYKHSGQVPDDQGLGRITTALQAVMTFSENFVPSAENTARLKQIKAQGAPVDTQQTGIQYIQAFIPVVNAIGDFSFGEPEQRLVQDVADRLTKKAMALRESIFIDLLSPDDQKFIELALLRSLTLIYSACHRTETGKLMQSGAAQTGSASMTSVWTSFDMRAAMLETLGAGLVPKSSAAASGAGDKAPAVTVSEKPPEQPPLPQTPPPPPPPQSTETQQAETGGNPMSMFAKPKEDSPPAAPEVPPEAPSSPPTPPTPPAETTPLPAEPPVQPPAQKESGGDPMSFFKSGDKSEKT
ncbi:MAG TPA: hypothetical protein ENJ57_07245 [Rhizobiales bacterium]|nr:hypothetical protein [Hyphomicrobiales bacterium]